VVTGQNYMTQQKTSNISKNIHNRLSVQVSLTGLSFLVKDLITEKTLYFTEKDIGNSPTAEELLLEIDTIIIENDMLQSKFDEVVVLYSNNVYTAVPSSLFDETKASEYLKFNSKILSNDFIAFDQIESNNMVVVYIPYVNINNYFFDRFGSFQYYHAVSVFLMDLLHPTKHSLNTKMHLNVQKEQLDVIILKEDKLLLCNSFLFKTSEDFIYYILFCLEQLRLNPDTIPVILSGSVEKDDLNYKMLYRYIRNISFIEDTTNTPNQSTMEVYHKNYLLKNAK
jgi:hypothetical protein